MIGYATLGTNDIDTALAFYDALFDLIGGARLRQTTDHRKLTYYGYGRNKPWLGIGRPHNGEPASAGNGVMIALAMDTREQVEAVHALALALGGADEGAPGKRGPEELSFYGAYFRDPDGNKLCVYKMG